MARAAKKETPLTTEEKLAKALVPEEEQPYPVPENWCWVRLGSLYEINPKNEASDELEAGFIPMEKISAGMCTSFNFDVRPWVKAKKGHVQLTNGDVAFAKISPCFENRKSMIVSGLPNGIGAGTTEIIVLRQPSVNNRFTFWLISTDDFIQKGRRTYSGTVGQQRISMDYVRQYPIPLPLLPEQQRIVTLIESLFANLDTAKEKLQAVLDGFSERKATILHQAFTGELTREWREKIGIGLDSCKDTILKEILDVRDGTHDSPQYHETGFPLITSKNLKNGKILEENLKFISKEDYDRINERSKVDSGDILFAMIGTIGNPTVIEKNPDFAIKNVALFKNINKVNVFFVKYYLESKRVVDKMTRESKGSTQRFVSLGYLRNFPIITPTIEEQKEIVRILDDIFAKESQSKAAVESALAKIDTMKKAILATAFRGGFETNDRSDGSAEELLRRVL